MDVVLHKAATWDWGEEQVQQDIAIDVPSTK